MRGSPKPGKRRGKPPRTAREAMKDSLGHVVLKNNSFCEVSYQQREIGNRNWLSRQSTSSLSPSLAAPMDFAASDRRRCGRH
jgi:hypothetical protein